MQGVYHQFALLLAVAAAVGIIALRLRQPLLVACIVVGIGLGPSALATGIGQIVFTTVIGFALALALGVTLGHANPAEVIVFGAGRFGCRLIEQLRAQGIHTLAVDFDPEVVHRLRRKGWPVRFGDAEDAEFPAPVE